jgi:predicted nucleic acid-binding protein
VGNAIWKLNVIHRKISSSEADILLESLLGIAADRMKLIPSAEIDHFSTMGLAREEKLTFYDASYLSVAIERNMLLVTDDKNLFDAARKHVKVRTSAAI